MNSVSHAKRGRQVPASAPAVQSASGLRLRLKIWRDSFGQMTLHVITPGHETLFALTVRKGKVDGFAYLWSAKNGDPSVLSGAHLDDFSAGAMAEDLLRGLAPASALRAAA